ncbi:hypothetical protein OXA73_23550 [Klebsiella pneumoniae]|mgnify:CR=1 FL=1|uniref:IS66 family insertion sequence element accessory protein TnpA n=1 Tax=Klebsiella pneumoniae TaxID=573 RepID=UPI002273FAF5|nr:hypothetical protein [Klebsiella pneumoniae]EIW5041751.1 IS66 family insertion sequence element accessory protein TnpB [Klebsiella pneumoniae]WDU74456.1 hypothetical protein PWK27_26095 [Klebsiella pneumoniae]HDK6669661.1 hypothetical protein [Klebsiella pneumoniae]
MTPAEREHHWQQQLERWHNSGLSGAAFCQRQLLSYHQFAYWRRKLEAVAAAPDAEHLPTTGFARVTRLGPASESVSSELTLTLPGGMTISGLHASNLDLLGAILRQLP